MHTEIQAQNLWCPLVQHQGHTGGSFNRGWSPSNPLNIAKRQEDASYLCNCIASRCAAWRWSSEPDVVSRPCASASAVTRPDYPSDIPPGWLFVPAIACCGLSAHWLAPPSTLPPQGYCGWIHPGDNR